MTGTVPGPEGGPLAASDLERLFALQESDGLFERLIEGLYRGLLRPGDVAVDGGAHLGLHTVPLARIVGPRGHVEAFEPLPGQSAQLRDRVARLGNVSVHEAALGDHDGIATFHVLPDAPWLSSLRDRHLVEPPHSTELLVSMVRLDRLADRPIRFLKLDLEGGEFHALQGATELLSRQAPVIAFECGRIGAARQFGYSAEAFFALFEDAGYGLVSLFGEPFTTHDFGRDWNDRVVPHYLVSGPLDRMPEIAGRLQALVRETLTTAAWRWSVRRRIASARPRVAAIPGARPAFRGLRSVAERIRR